MLVYVSVNRDIRVLAVHCVEGGPFEATMAEEDVNMLVFHILLQVYQQRRAVNISAGPTVANYTS